MKYGVNTMVWTTRVGKEIEPLFLRIKKWGFDGVELFLSPEEPADVPAVKSALDRAGLGRTTCSVLPRQANLVSSQPEVRARGVEQLKKCAQRTAELGASLMCGPLHSGLGGIPGTGHNDWRGVLLTLKAIGYDGWLTIESFAQPEPELAAAAAIWRDLAPSGDVLAQRGLRFIKHLAREVGVDNGGKAVGRKQKAVGRRQKAERKSGGKGRKAKRQKL